MKYFHLRLRFELFLSHLRYQPTFKGNVVLGIVPLSWRNPEIVAHATAEALAGLFFSYSAKEKRNTSLTVLIRSLDEPVHFYQVFDKKYFKNFRTKHGHWRTLRDVWSYV